MRFNTTKNLLKDVGEYFDSSWIKNEKFVNPKFKKWDYSRELHIEDVDLWEIIYEQNGVVSVYAAYSPYAELYLIRFRSFLQKQGHDMEVYYGPGAMKKVMKRMDEMKIPYYTHPQFVEPEDMWLYTN